MRDDSIDLVGRTGCRSSLHWENRILQHLSWVYSEQIDMPITVIRQKGNRQKRRDIHRVKETDLAEATHNELAKINERPRT